MSEELRVICIDAHVPPLFLESSNGRREGYEPAAARLVATHLGRELRWIFRPWQEMLPALEAGDGDAVWCGQGITEERRRVVDFTRPYAIFNESVLVPAGSGVAGPDALAGRRVGALENSTNMALAETFPDVELVGFDGSADDVFGQMVDALASGRIDALVDDDVAFVPLAADDRFEIAFTVPTRNAWGVAVAKSRPELRDQLDAALASVIADGSLAEAWRHWMPELPFPFDEALVDEA